MASDNRYGTMAAPPIADPNLGFGGADQQSLGSRESHSFLWTGHILHVDVETMVCSLAIDLGGAKEWHDVPLPAPAGTGPRSWAGCVPEPGTKVLVEWAKYDSRNFKPFIVGFMTAGTFPARQYEPFSTCYPNDAKEALAAVPSLAMDPRYRLDVIRLKMRKAYGGDFLATSSGGADFLLDRDTTLQNRAGNEFKLRDSDQTAVLQTVNEFVSNSAGFYRRGLIRRNAFNFLPDLMLSATGRDYGKIGDKTVEEALVSSTQTITNSEEAWSTVLVDKIDPVSPAFDVLSGFGMIDSTGKVTIPDQTQPIYPFVVMPDGRRQSYVVHGTHDLRWDQNNEGYVEDRRELFHTSDGVMAVSEEGDGIQVDNLLDRIFIEDVAGTVVGNDPYSDPGRALYKRILSMSMFNSVDDMEKPQAELFAVDTAQTPSLSDTIALARLFKIKCPNDDARQYTFGITKEGRVFLNVPASRGELQSIDMATMGGVKAFLGANSDLVSLNLKTVGGIKLDIGSFKDDSSDGPDSVSVDITYHGKIKQNYVGMQGRETSINGTEYVSVGGSHVTSAAGGHVVMAGGIAALEAEGARRNLGTGGYALRSLGSYDLTCLDKASEAFAKLRTITHALGSFKLVLAGVDTTVMVSGVHSTTVATGAYAVTVGAGNLSLACGTNMIMGSGVNLTMTAGAAVSTVAAGAVTSVAGGVNTMMGTVAAVQAPVVKVGLSVVGCIMAGIPGPPSFAVDYVTGLPLLGMPTALIGP